MYIESITPELLDKLEYASFPGKIFVIDSVGAEFNRAIAYLRSQKVIGFDTETRPCFGPNQPRYGVALLQLSGPEKAYLFRIKNMGMHRRLCNLLADKRIIKVGAAIHDDIRGLQKLREFESLLSHKIFIGGFTAYKGNKFLAPLYQLYLTGNTFVKLVHGNFTFYASVAELV